MLIESYKQELKKNIFK